MLPDGVFAPVARYLRERTVEIHGNRGSSGIGSGVIWSSDGLIVTNAHVIRDQNVTVTLADRRTIPAKVADQDQKRDLAALRIDASGLPYASVADSSQVRAGEIVFASGNPLGVTGAVTQGVMHASGPLEGRGGAWLQADIRLAPGNSGGMLANACGALIGINTMIFAGLALAVPANAVRRFLDGRRTPRLGVTMQAVRVKGGNALMILEVEPGGAAHRAGMLAGDAILHSMDELSAALDAASDSGELRIDYLRGGSVLSDVISFRSASSGQSEPGARAA